MMKPDRRTWTCVVVYLTVVMCFGCLGDEPELVGSTPDAGRQDAGIFDDASVELDMEPFVDVMIADATIPWAPTLPEHVTAQACGQRIPMTGSVTGPDDSDERSQRLATKAQRFEQVFHALNTQGTGLNADLVVVDSDARARVEAFTLESDPTTEPQSDELRAMVADFGKAAGLYGGVGIGADAYRYMTLRDSGADCTEVELARTRVLAALETLHTATRITGAEGVLVRALANVNLPGAGQNTTVPLFDETGQALPLEKNNGTWRADQSGLYPDLIWEDSCSRDMYVGWALAYAAVWEAVRTDATIADSLKLRLRIDAKTLVDRLMEIGEEGFDLEIRDADGRRTYHGILHEHSVDRVYIMNFPNGFNGLLAAGIVGALAYVSGDVAQKRYLEDELIDERGLLALAQGSLLGLDLGPGSNFSGYNMAFTGAWLAARYLSRTLDRNTIRLTLRDALYNRADAPRQPREQSQALYHLVFAQSELGSYAGGQDQVTALEDLDEVIEYVRRDLDEFPQPPFFGRSVVNCDEAEIASTDCVADDGTPLPLLGPVGWNDDLIAAVPVPMRLRPISNYYWRSNPYAVNGVTSDLVLLPGSDFRWVYWSGRLLNTALEVD